MEKYKNSNVERYLDLVKEMGGNGEGQGGEEMNQFRRGGGLPRFEGDVGDSETKSKATVFIGDGEMFEEDFERMKADLDKQYGAGNYQVIRAADIQDEMNKDINSGKESVDFSIDKYNELLKLKNDRSTLIEEEAYQIFKRNNPDSRLSKYDTAKDLMAGDALHGIDDYQEYVQSPHYMSIFDDDEWMNLNDKFSNYAQKKKAYDSRDTVYQKLSSKEKLEYYKSYFGNMEEGSDVYILKHGDNMFLSNAGTLSEGTRSDFNYGNTPGKIDTFAEAMTAWGPATTGTCYMGVCNGLPSAAHIANETGMTTKAQKGDWAGYYDRTGTYGNDQTFDEQFFNPQNKGNKQSGGYYNTYTKDGDRVNVESTGYMAPGASSNHFWDDDVDNFFYENRRIIDTRQKYGGQLPIAQEGQEGGLDRAHAKSWSDEEAISFYENNIGNKDLWGTEKLWNPTPDRIRHAVDFKTNDKLWNNFSKYISRILTPSVDEAFQTLLAPQAFVTEGVEALRGEPYNFSNALPSFTSEQEKKEGVPTSTQRPPSETYASEWSPVWQTVADIGFDPLIGGPIALKGASLLNKANKTRKLNNAFVKALDNTQPVISQKSIVPIERNVTSDFSDFSKVESPFRKEQQLLANWDNTVSKAVGKTDNLPLVRVQGSEGLSFKNGKLVKSNEPFLIGDKGNLQTRNTTHFGYGHVGENSAHSWMDYEIAIITNMDDARKSGVLHGFSPTDTWFYNKGNFVFPDNTIILTRDKAFYNQAKKANYNNIKYVGDDIDKLAVKERKRLKALSKDDAISTISGKGTYIKNGVITPEVSFGPGSWYGEMLPSYIDTPTKAKKYLKEATWNDGTFSEYMKLPDGRYMSRHTSRGKDQAGNVIGGFEMITKEGKLTDVYIDAVINGSGKSARAEASYKNSIFEQMVNEASGNSYGMNSKITNHISHRARYANKEFQTAEEVGQDWTNYYNKLTDAERSSFTQGRAGPALNNPRYNPSHHSAAHSNSGMNQFEWGNPNYNQPFSSSIYSMDNLPMNLRINEITKFERSGLRSKEWVDDQIRMMEEGTGKTWDELINLPEYVNMKKYGGSLPIAQTGVQVAGPLYDLNGKCFSGCGQRNYLPEHNLSIGTKFNADKVDDQWGIGMGAYAGYSLNPLIQGRRQEGLKGYLGANYGARLSDLSMSGLEQGVDPTITPYSEAVASVGYEGEVGDAGSYANYLRGRRGDPLKWGVGAFGKYDIMGDKGLTVGGYGNYGNLNVSGGYNPNSGWSATLGFGVPIRKDGGSLPKAQLNLETPVSYTIPPLPIHRADATYVHPDYYNHIPIAEEEQYVDKFGSTSGSIYPTGDKLKGNNPNLQWISGASNQMYSSPEQKQRSQDYAQHWLGAAVPIPILEGINLTSKGARIPGLIDDAIINPLIKGYKGIKSLSFKPIINTPTPRATAFNKHGQVKTSFDDQLKVVDQKQYNEIVRAGKIPARDRLYSYHNGYFDIKVRGNQSIPNNPWNVQITSPKGPDAGFMQLVKSEKGVYHLDMSMKSPMDAGQAINYLAEYVPKGAIIKTAPNGSLSLDSYKLMTNQIKRGKFSYIPSDRTVQLNMMSKDMAKIDVNNAGMVTKTEADRIVKDINKMLDDAGIKQRATATNVSENAKDVLNYPPSGPQSLENFLTWKVEIPELAIKVKFKEGGELPKAQNSAEIDADGNIFMSQTTPINQQVVTSTSSKEDKKIAEKNRKQLIANSPTVEIADELGLFKNKEEKKIEIKNRDDNKVFNEEWDNTLDKFGNLDLSKVKNWSDEQAMYFYEQNKHDYLKGIWKPTPDKVRKQIDFYETDILWKNFSKPLLDGTLWLGETAVESFSSPENMALTVAGGAVLNKVIPAAGGLFNKLKNSKYKGQSATHTYNPKTKTWIENNANAARQNLLQNDIEFIAKQSYLTNKITKLQQGKIKITEEIRQFKINNPGKPVPNDLTKVDNIINSQLKAYTEQLNNIPPTYTELGSTRFKDNLLDMDEFGNFNNQAYDDFLSGKTPPKTWTGPTLQSSNDDIIKGLNAELKLAEEIDLKRMIGDYKWDNRNIFQKYFDTPKHPFNISGTGDKPFWVDYKEGGEVVKHTIVKGDTGKRLKAMYGTELKDILKHNNLKYFKLGAEIEIPKYQDKGQWNPTDPDTPFTYEDLYGEDWENIIEELKVGEQKVYPWQGSSIRNQTSTGKDPTYWNEDGSFKTADQLIMSTNKQFANFKPKKNTTKIVNEDIKQTVGNEADAVIEIGDKSKESADYNWEADLNIDDQYNLYKDWVTKGDDRPLTTMEKHGFTFAQQDFIGEDERGRSLSEVHQPTEWSDEKYQSDLTSMNQGNNTGFTWTPNLTLGEQHSKFIDFITQGEDRVLTKKEQDIFKALRDNSGEYQTDPTVRSIGGDPIGQSHGILFGDAFGLNPEGSGYLGGGIFNPIMKSMFSKPLEILSTPASLVAEGLESYYGWGDGEFNFTDALPNLGLSAPFTNYKGEEGYKRSSDIIPGMEDAHWLPKFAVDLFTDPLTYLTAGTVGTARSAVRSSADDLLRTTVRSSDDLLRTVGKTKSDDLLKTSIKSSDNLLTTKSDDIVRGVTTNKSGQIKTSFDNKLTTTKNVPYEKQSITTQKFFDADNINVSKGELSVGTRNANIEIATDGSGKMRIDIDIPTKSGLLSDGGDMVLQTTNKPGVFDIHMSMRNPKEAYHSIKYLEEFMPKGSVLSTTNFSTDSYTLMLNRLRPNSKFTYVDDGGKGYVHLSQSGKAQGYGFGQGWPKDEALIQIAKVNKQLEKAGIPYKAKLGEFMKDSGEYLIDIPNVMIKLGFKLGGEI